MPSGMTIVKAFAVVSRIRPLGILEVLKPFVALLQKADKSSAERLELKLTGWLAVRAEGRAGFEPRYSWYPG
jgi:hypothetical protein